MKIWNEAFSPTKTIATSLILKDMVGCYLYVTQARSNKKFSIKQRADVANYDLLNGIINVSLQILAIGPIEKAMEKFIKSKCIQHFLTNLDKIKAGDDQKLLRKVLKHKEGLVKGATAALSVIICQYIIKRAIAPFFSVPAGEWAKRKGIIKPKIYPGEVDTTKQNDDKKDKKTLANA